MKFSITILSSLVLFIFAAGILFSQDPAKEETSGEKMADAPPPYMDILESPVDTAKTYRMLVMGWGEFVGKILKIKEDHIIFSTAAGPEKKIMVEDIIGIEEIDPQNIKNGIYYYPNPNAHRYFISITGIRPEAGEVIYQNTYFIINSVEAGITDYLSLGGGIEFSSLIFGEPLFWAGPKLGAEVIDNLHLSTGLIYLGTEYPLTRPGDNYNIPYLQATYGNSDNNLSLGWGYITRDFKMKYNSRFISVGGMYRPVRYFSFVTDNTFFPDDFIGMFGIRFFGEFMTIDAGFLMTSSMLSFGHPYIIAIPYLDFSMKF